MEQLLANFIQNLQQCLAAVRSLYDDESLVDWATAQAAMCEQMITDSLANFNEVTGIDYDSPEASALVIKEGSTVTVLADHMPGMAGATAVVAGYSLPAMVSDIVMADGTEMPDHRWLTNDEVEVATAAEAV